MQIKAAQSITKSYVACRADLGQNKEIRIQILMTGNVDCVLSLNHFCQISPCAHLLAQTAPLSSKNSISAGPRQSTPGISFATDFTPSLSPTLARLIGSEGQSNAIQRDGKEAGRVLDVGNRTFPRDYCELARVS